MKTIENDAQKPESFHTSKYEIARLKFVKNIEKLIHKHNKANPVVHPQV